MLYFKQLEIIFFQTDDYFKTTVWMNQAVQNNPVKIVQDNFEVYSIFSA